MKTLFTVLFVAFLAVTTSAVATDVHPTVTKNKPTSCFDYFRVHRQGVKDIALTWSVSTPGIVSFTIEESTDGSYFLPVGSEQCRGTGPHKLMRSIEYPGTYYYRITAVRGDGSTEYSSVGKVFFVQRG